MSSTTETILEATKQGEITKVDTSLQEMEKKKQKESDLKFDEETLRLACDGDSEKHHLSGIDKADNSADTASGKPTSMQDETPSPKLLKRTDSCWVGRDGIDGTMRVIKPPQATSSHASSESTAVSTNSKSKRSTDSSRVTFNQMMKLLAGSAGSHPSQPLPHHHSFAIPLTPAFQGLKQSRKCPSQQAAAAPPSHIPDQAAVVSAEKPTVTKTETASFSAKRPKTTN